MKIRDIPIVFMSFDEPWADEYWEDLRSKAPWAKRVHGVVGLDACHKAALDAAGGDWVITVDADTIVRPSFFDQEVPKEFIRPYCRIEWPSKNVVNGLAYGNGSLKCWPAHMVRTMQTHEAAPEGSGSVDHDVGTDMKSTKGNMRAYRPSIQADVNPALTPYHAFRCGFREGVRLALGYKTNTDTGTDLSKVPERLAYRLSVWCSVGSDYENGNWLIYGARLGLWMIHSSDWDYRQINSYQWFATFWNDLIQHRFGPGGSRCKYTDFTWDEGKLQSEIIALGKRLDQHLHIDVFDLTPAESKLFKLSANETLDWVHCDTFGYMYLKGLGVDKDLEKAREMFEIGETIGVSASVNNLARMRHFGHGEKADPLGSIPLYEQAIEMGNKFAPYHLADLLAEQFEGDATMEMRAQALKQLSAQRGFDPDRLIQAGAIKL